MTLPWAVEKFNAHFFCTRPRGLSEDNGTKHEGGVHLEEHHEAYSNMSTVLKTIDVPDELDWREYGEIFKVLA